MPTSLPSTCTKTSRKPTSSFASRLTVMLATKFERRAVLTRSAPRRLPGGFGSAIASRSSKNTTTHPTESCAGRKLDGCGQHIAPHSDGALAARALQLEEENGHSWMD